MKRILSFLLLLISLIGFDQLIKWWMVKNHPSLVSFNQGVVFGWFNHSVGNYILIGFGFLLLICLIYKTRLREFQEQLAVVLILAGALSNLFDRFYFGQVVDYFNLRFLIGLDWPFFNLADLFIIAGTLLYVYKIFRNK